MLFAGKVLQQIVGILMGTNYAPLLADIFLNSHEVEFIQTLLPTGRNSWHLGSISHICTEDVLSINNPEFEKKKLGPDVSR